MSSPPRASIRTAKGAGGGSYVTLPTVDHISSRALEHRPARATPEHVTLEELLEARELLEVPAARFAARRRRGATSSGFGRPSRPTPRARHAGAVRLQQGLPLGVIEPCGNSMLTIAAQPIFAVLQTNLARSQPRAGVPPLDPRHHGRIAEAVEAGDAEAAGEQMHDHLEYLRPYYEKAWRHAVAAGARA